VASLGFSLRSLPPSEKDFTTPGEVGEELKSREKLLGKGKEGK